MTIATGSRCARAASTGVLPARRLSQTANVFAAGSQNAVIIGLLVILFAVWAMFMDTAVQKWWQERHLFR